MAACSCDVTFNNTGLPSCVPLFDKIKKIILVPIEANDGTLNKIDLTATLNAAYFNAFINNADSSKRWYPLPSMKNVELTKAENVLESFNDGTSAFVKEGKRSFSALFTGQGAKFAGVLKASRCATFGIFGIDSNGSIIGYTNNEENVLYPIPVDASTWAPVWQAATDTTIQKVVLNFDFDTNLMDEYLWHVPSGDITGINLLNVSGLVDVLSTNTSVGQTSWVVKLYSRYNTKIKGLVAGDFAIYNVTDSAAVTVVSCTEVDGTYTLTYASQTVADVLRLTPTKTGYDFTEVIAKTGTVA